MNTGVWIVMHDDEPDQDPVLGVFASPSEAEDFVSEVAARFPDGSITTTHYAVGWRYDSGARRYA